jgi:hypothetical protein
MPPHQPHHVAMSQTLSFDMQSIHLTKLATSLKHHYYVQLLWCSSHVFQTNLFLTTLTVHQISTGPTKKIAAGPFIYSALPLLHASRDSTRNNYSKEETDYSTVRLGLLSSCLLSFFHPLRTPLLL